MQNKNTLALAEKIRFEREQSFLEDREGYRLRKDMDEDFLEFCNEFIKSPALTKYTRITLGHGLQKFKNFLVDTPRCPCQAQAFQFCRDNIQGRGWHVRRLILTVGAWDSASCDFLFLPYNYNFAQR